MANNPTTKAKTSIKATAARKPVKKPAKVRKISASAAAALVVVSAVVSALIASVVAGALWALGESATFYLPFACVFATCFPLVLWGAAKARAKLAAMF